MFLALLAVPLLLRLSFQRKSTLSLFGFFQDLLFVFEEIFLLQILWALTGKWWALALVAAILQIYLLLDAFLFTASQLRMRFAFFTYLTEWRSFKDSVEKEGVKKFYLIAFSLLLYNAVLFGFTGLLLPSFSRTFLLSGVGTLAVVWTSIKFPTHFLKKGISNILIEEQISFIKRLFVKKKEKNKEEISLSQSEDYRLISPEFPLLRFTKGFQGEIEEKIHLSFQNTEKPHIVFLMLESWRAKDVGCLGGFKEATPCFDRLSQEGALFSQFYAHGGKTHRALLASLYGLPSDGGDKQRITDQPLRGLPHVLRNVGYQAAYLHGHYRNVDRWQLEFMQRHGFDQILDKSAIDAFSPNAMSSSWGVHDEYLLSFAGEWLVQQDRMDKPTFLVLPTISTHHPWNIPPQHQSPEFTSKDDRYRHYLRALHYSDSALGNWMDMLKKKGIDKRTIFFIFGDHGCRFEEDGGSAIPYHLYEEILHVPLLILAEGKIQKPCLISELAGQCDLLPTVMDLLHLEGINQSVGRSLLRKRESVTIYFQDTLMPHLIGCRTGHYKTITNLETQERMLFDLKRDPQEKENLALNQPEIAERFERDAKAYFSALDQVHTGKHALSGKLFNTKWAYQSGDPFDITLLTCLLKKNVHLEELSFAGASFLTDNELEIIAKYGARLKRVNFSGCHAVTDQGLQHLVKGCPHLQVMDLSGCCSLTDAGVKRAIDALNDLEQLKLRGIKSLSNDLWKGLGKKKRLYQLDLLECPLFSDEGLEKLTQVFPNLRVFFLTCPLITDLGMQKMAAHTKHLTALYLQEAFLLTDQSLSQLFAVNHQLEFFFLEDCKLFTGNSFASLPLSSLTLLHINDAPALADEALSHLKGSELVRISLAFCPEITDRGLSYLEDLPLESCFFAGCPRITQDAIDTLSRSISPNATTL